MIPREFTKIAQQLEAKIKAAAVIGLHEAAEFIKEEAKALIGHEHEQWPPLAKSTLKEKERLGVKVPAPLLRTGELRDSIQVKVVGLNAVIGSDSEEAVYHEHGTSKMPPRPFLSTAVVTKSSEAVALIEAAIARALK